MLASKLIAIKSGADLTKLARWKRAARCLIDKLIRLRLSSCGTSVRFSKPQTGDAPYSSRLSVQDRDVLYLISSDVCCTRKPQFQASEIARNLRVPWIKRCRPTVPPAYATRRPREIFPRWQALS